MKPHALYWSAFSTLLTLTTYHSHLDGLRELRLQYINDWTTNISCLFRCQRNIQATPDDQNLYAMFRSFDRSFIARDYAKCLRLLQRVNEYLSTHPLPTETGLDPMS